MANEIYHRSNWGNAVNDNAWGDTYEKFDATNEMFVRSDHYENSNETDKLMAAIYPKPSILLTPTAYDNGSLHSVKPVYSLGSELVTNGDFAIDSNWNKTNATISNGIATITVTSGGFSQIKQPITYTSGKQYKLTAKIQGLSGSSGKDIRFQDSGGNNGGLTTANGIITLDESLQNIDIIWIANSNSSEIVIARSTTSGDYVWTVDNVSVKEVIDADFDFTRGSSATRVAENGLIEDVQILSSNLVTNGDFSKIGSELVTNGGFDSDSDWEFSGTANISNGVANFPNNTNSFLIQVSVVDLSVKTYKIEYEVISTNGNNFRLAGGNSAFGTVTLDSATIGVKTFYLQSNGTKNRLQFNNNQFIGSIDNVSVKEVGQNWTLIEDVSIGNGVATFLDSGSNPNTRLIQSNILTSGKSYKLSFEVTRYVAGRVQVLFGSSTTLELDISSGVGTYTIFGVSDGTNITIKRSGGYPNFDFDITNISVIEITDDTNLPRIDYTSGTGSLLLEPQSTNTVRYSEDFSNAEWGQVGSPTLTGGQLAPDGTLTATKISGTIGSTNIALGTSSSTTATRTIYARTVSGTGTAKLMSFYNNTNNLFTITEEWQRFELTGAISTGGPTFYIDFRDFSQTLSEFIIWGAQSEELTYATSYIPTNGSTVTRLADVCNNAGSSDLISSTEGVLYAEVSKNTTTIDGGIAISDGSTDNRILFYFDISGNIRAYVYANGEQARINTSGLNYTLMNKIAIKYSATSTKFFVNGNQVGSTDTSSNMPSGLSQLAFDNGGGGSDFYGNVKSVAVFKEALGNDQLERLTGEGYETFNLLAQANNYTII